MPFRFPRYDELAADPTQLEVLEYPLNQSLFIVGPPGSGKTMLAVRRAIMAARLNPNVSMVTYNRMLRRLLSLLLSRQNFNAYKVINIHTMHAFVGHHYTFNTGQLVPKDTKNFSFQWTTMFDNLRKLEVAPSYSHLVVDEGQDLPKQFFEYAHDFVSRTMTVFADEEQAIVEEHSSLRQIKHAAKLKDPVILNTNHRNTPEIARLAEHFHQGALPATQVARSASGELPRLTRSPNLQLTANLITNWYLNRGGSIGVIVSESSTGEEVLELLKTQSPESKILSYSSAEKNEDSINILAEV